MARYRVHYEGYTYVEADSELEAESTAAFECSPDNCTAECMDVEDDEDEEDED